MTPSSCTSCFEKTVPVVPSHVAITFGDMRVDVRLSPGPRGTRIALEQSAIALDDKGRAEGHLNCRCCWSYYLLNLRAVIEHNRLVLHRTDQVGIAGAEFLAGAQSARGTPGVTVVG